MDCFESQQRNSNLIREFLEPVEVCEQESF